MDWSGRFKKPKNQMESMHLFEGLWRTGGLEEKWGSENIFISLPVSVLLPSTKFKGGGELKF